MKLNKKLLVSSIVLLILLWSGNIFYYEKHILKEPLFIKCYYNLPSGLDMFNLYYIQNINSQDNITEITFPEIGIQPLTFSVLDMNTDGKNYRLKMLSINKFNNYLNKIPNEYKKKILTKANIKFSNGKIMTVNLGKIYFNGETEVNEIRNTDLIQSSGSSCNDSTGSTIFTAKKDLTILSISNKFYDEIKDILKVNINGKELSNIVFPIKLKKDDQVSINYGFTFNQNDIRKNYLYNLAFYISTVDSKGTKGNSLFGIGSSIMQYPDNFDIDALKNHMEEN